MKCTPIVLPDGGTAIVCGRGPRAKPCSVCGNYLGSQLCDGRIPGKRSTCNAPLCKRCATTQPNPRNSSDTLDYCPRCVRARPPEQLGLGSGT